LPQGSDKYDNHIKRATHQYLGHDWPWERLWALSYQESRFNCNAVSPVGAVGCLQFLPRTWAEESRRIGLSGADPKDIRAAAPAGASYLSVLHKFWVRRNIREVEARGFAEASYNGGMGMVQKHWLRLGKPDTVEKLADVLPAETADYTRKIQKWFLLKLNESAKSKRSEFFFSWW
jgi:soluble lytic murein transglycosylase-like protein